MLQEANPEGSQALEGLIHGYLGVRMHTYTEILFFFSFLSFYFFFFLGVAATSFSLYHAFPDWLILTPWRTQPCVWPETQHFSPLEHLSAGQESWQGPLSSPLHWAGFQSNRRFHSSCTVYSSKREIGEFLLSRNSSSSSSKRQEYASK